MNILDEIMIARKKRVMESMRTRTLEELREDAIIKRRSAPPFHLSATLSRNNGLNIIAEFKRRSPSKGVIREGAAPGEVARRYALGGAVAISVLTEGDFFGGSLEDLHAVRAEVNLPVLRKDFVFHKYQIYEAAAAGADAVLLIVAALDDDSLAELRSQAEELGLDALVEVHTSDEMRRASKSGAHLIGVNNRDLTTFEVSLETSAMLFREAPQDCILVSESGLENGRDLRSLKQLGYQGFLIGEWLMRAEAPEATLRRLLKEASGKPV